MFQLVFLLQSQRDALLYQLHNNVRIKIMAISAKVVKSAKSRKTLTAQELEAKMQKMRATLAALEQRTYSTQLQTAIDNSNVVAAIQSVKSSVTKATDVAIISAIAKAAGFKRLEITQKPVAPRTPAKKEPSAKVKSTSSSSKKPAK